MQPKITLDLWKMWVKMITYIVILWCVQHNILSNTLLCPAKYCVHTYPKDLLFTFHISTSWGRIMLNRLQSTSVLGWVGIKSNNYFWLAKMTILFNQCHVMLFLGCIGKKAAYCKNLKKVNFTHYKVKGMISFCLWNVLMINNVILLIKFIMHIHGIQKSKIIFISQKYIPYKSYSVLLMNTIH